jgi:hypothetical protein
MKAAPKMKPYLSDHDSGVVAYLFVKNSIILKYINEEMLYLYTPQTTGARHISIMKEKAEKGSGLSGYVSKNVKKNFRKHSLNLEELINLAT